VGRYVEGRWRGNLISHFDLVAGTSTGAILAIGLAMGLQPREILEFYEKKGPQIFRRIGNFGTGLNPSMTQQLSVDFWPRCTGTKRWLKILAAAW
jgi:patatin-like phospholipase/acyl hydrolase